MSPRVRSIALIVAQALGWLVTIVGCIIILGALASLYFLLVKGIPPGQMMFRDFMAPPLSGVLLHLTNGAVLAVIPFTLRWSFRRWVRSPASGA